MSEVQVPHLKIPFRIDRTGSASVLEQDEVSEVAQCVEVLLSTRVGERLEVPDYGVDDPVFDVEPDLEEIASAIEEWEPRAASDIDSETGLDDELVRHVIARVAVRE